MASICQLQYSNKFILFLLFATYISLTQSIGWPWKRSQQNFGLKVQNRKPLSALSTIDEWQPTSSVSIAAKTLTDSYYSKFSVVSVRQEPNILDLAQLLSGPAFANIENDIISASARLAGLTNSRTEVGGVAKHRKEEPPEDEDDDDIDDEIDEKEEDETDSSQLLHPELKNNKQINEKRRQEPASMESALSERLMDIVSSKVLSMSKVVLKAARLLLGYSFDVMGRAMSGPVKKTIAKVVKERKISACSKMSLNTVVKENEKLEVLVQTNKCNLTVILEHSLINLKVALSILKCYTSSSIDVDDKEEHHRFDSQLIDMSKLLTVVERSYQKSSTRHHSDPFLTTLIQTQITELREKFTELLTNDLILRLSIYDAFIQTFTINIQQILRDISEGVYTYIPQHQSTTTNDNHDNDDINNDTNLRESCVATLNSALLLSNDIRSLGTTTVDKLIGVAKNIVNSFEGITDRLSLGMDQLNSYRDMYEQLFSVARNLKPEVFEKIEK